MSKIACRPRCLGGCAEHQGNDPRTGLLPLSLPARVPDCDIYGFHKQRCSQGGVRESWSCLPLTVLDLSSGLSCRFQREGAVSNFSVPFFIYTDVYRLHKALQKGGVPAAPSGTATLLRLSPNHQFCPRPTLAVTDFRHPRLSWLDGRCVQGPGTYSPRHG